MATPAQERKFLKAWGLAQACMKTDVLETDAFCEAWRNWVDYRHKRRKPLTFRAVKLQIGKLESWGQDRAIQAIDNAIEKGWATVYEPDITEKGSPELLGDFDDEP